MAFKTFRGFRGRKFRTPWQEWLSSTSLPSSVNDKIRASINPSEQDIASFNATEPERKRRNGFATRENRASNDDYGWTQTCHGSLEHGHRVDRQLGGMLVAGENETPERERVHELLYDVTTSWPVPKANGYFLARYSTKNDKLLRYPVVLQRHMFEHCPDIHIMHELTAKEFMRNLDFCKAVKEWPCSEEGMSAEDHEGRRRGEYLNGNMIGSPQLDTEFAYNPAEAYHSARGYFKNVSSVPSTPLREELTAMTAAILKKETEARLEQKKVPKEEWPSDEDYRIRAVFEYAREYESNLFDDFRDFWPTFPYVCKLKPNRYFFSMEEMAHSIHPIWGMYGNDCLINGWNAFPQEFLGARKPVGWRGYFISDDPRELIPNGPLRNEFYHKMPIAMFRNIKLPPYSYPSWYWTVYTPEKNVAINLSRTNGGVFAIDIDVKNRAAVGRIVEIIEEKLGLSPFIRTGNYPKVLLLYRAPEGVSITSKVVKLRDDLGMVEILGEGKTFTAFGIHHSMRTTFQWIGGRNPVENKPEDVPIATESDLCDVLNSVSCELGEAVAVTLSETYQVTGGSAFSTGSTAEYPVDANGFICDNRSRFVGRICFLGYSRYIKQIEKDGFLQWRDDCVADIMETLRSRMLCEGRWAENSLQREVVSNLTRLDTNVKRGSVKLEESLSGAGNAVSKTGEIRTRRDGAAVQTVDRSNHREGRLYGSHRVLENPDVTVDDKTPYVPKEATPIERGEILSRPPRKAYTVPNIGYKIAMAVEDNLKEFADDVYRFAEHVKSDSYKFGDVAGEIFTNDAPTGSGKTSQIIKQILADPRTVQDMPWKDKKGVVTYKRRPIVIAMPNYGNINEAVARANILCMSPDLSDEEMMAEMVRLKCATSLEDARIRLPETRQLISTFKRDPTLPTPKIKVYEGRERAGCKFKYELNSLARAHQPADRLCKTGKEGDKNFSVCPHYEECAYIQQKKEIEDANIVFMVHSFVSSGGLPECIEQARALIIDEQIYQQFMHYEYLTRAGFDISPEIFKIWNEERADEDKVARYIEHNDDMWNKRSILPSRDWVIDTVIDAVKAKEDPARLIMDSRKGFNLSAWRRDNAVPCRKDDDDFGMPDYYDVDGAESLHDDGDSVLNDHAESLTTDSEDAAYGDDAAGEVVSFSVPMSQIRQSADYKAAKKAQLPREVYRNYLIDDCENDDSGDTIITLHEALLKCDLLVTSLFKQDVRIEPKLENDSVKLKLAQPGVINAEAERELWRALIARCDKLRVDEGTIKKREAYAERMMSLLDEDAEEIAENDSRMPNLEKITERIEKFNKENPLLVTHLDPRFQYVIRRQEIDGVIMREESLRVSWRTHPGWEQTPIMLLDASTDIDIVEKIFGPHENGAVGRPVRRKKIIEDVGTALNLDIVVVTDHMYSNNSLIGAKDATITQTMKASVNMANARDAVSMVCAMHAGSRVVVGAPKNVRRTLLTGWTDMPSSLDSCHFGAMRGIDAYKKHAASVCIGRMEPPIEAIDAMAACLSYDDVNYEAPFNRNGNGFDDDGEKPLFQPTEERQIRMRSGGIASFMTPMVPGVWGRRVQKQSREEEINQFIGRLRPVYREGDRPTCYILSSTIPEHLVLDDVISIYDLVGTDGITNISQLKKGYETLGNVPAVVRDERAVKWEFSCLLRIVNRLGGFLNPREIISAASADLPPDIRTEQGIMSVLETLHFRPDSESDFVKAGEMHVDPRSLWMSIGDGWHGVEMLHGDGRKDVVWFPGHGYKSTTEAHRAVEVRYGAEISRTLHVASRAECYTREMDSVVKAAIYGIEKPEDRSYDVAMGVYNVFDLLKNIPVKDLIEGRGYKRTAIYRTCRDTETLTSGIPVYALSKTLLDAVMGVHPGMKADILAKMELQQMRVMSLKLTKEQIMAFLAMRFVWNGDLDSLVAQMEMKAESVNAEADQVPEFSAQAA